jgi:DNA replication protein DnaC
MACRRPGHQACRDNRSVLYQRIPKLFADLALARGDGRYARLLRALAGVQLLIRRRRPR